ncbi:unnamed protein product [Protopolystoma xenopodis]|uniref:Uncharacterized protein n=1 Tax=Protopolystoma xenopodis TaxID=117903 RepID=A0A448XIH2_9PLAT|nr:unnamed protein product [Protopolystoma xenopodis]
MGWKNAYPHLTTHDNLATLSVLPFGPPQPVQLRHLAAPLSQPLGPALFAVSSKRASVQMACHHSLAQLDMRQSMARPLHSRCPLLQIPLVPLEQEGIGCLCR